MEIYDHPTFGDSAQLVLRNGYGPLPVRPNSKQPAAQRWNLFCGRVPTERELESLKRTFPHCGIGIACGENSALAIDIDAMDERRANEIEQWVVNHLGPTHLTRVGMPPKRLLLYRAKGLIATRHLPNLDVLGHGSFFVAFGIHPSTGRPYEWLGVSPLDVPMSDLPEVRPAQMDELAQWLRPEVPDLRQEPRPRTRTRIVSTSPSPWPKDRDGKTLDGRDSHLTKLVFDAAAGNDSVDDIAAEAWKRFKASADLTRNKRDGTRPWSFADARQKAEYLLRRRKGGSRGSTSAFSWTPALKNAFATQIALAGSLRQLPPAAVRISNMMLGVVHGQGLCTLSVHRIAEELWLAENTVKKARRLLRRGGFWIAARADGGRGRATAYEPNPDVLNRRFELNTLSFAQTVDAPSPQIASEESVDWSDLINSKNEGEESDE